MDIYLARQISLLVEDIDAEDDGTPEAQVKIAALNKALDALLEVAQRQELIERAQQVALESYRGTR